MEVFTPTLKRRIVLRFAIFLAVFACGLLSHTKTAHAQSFGQNKVQYSYFDWRYLAAEHFDLYYYQGGRATADFAIEVAEAGYRDLTQRLRYSGAGDKPLVLVTYQSHNDFEQTNVTSEPPEESVGGFTEFLRTRVVVPFEGNHEDFRHVIHHELTHAITLTLLYGQGFGAVLSGVSQARLPLWFIEGLAEYQSRNGLDSETEMFLRDAVANDNLPEIYQLEEMGYLGVYKCGQSILYYIAWRYGDEKIGEILHQMKGMRDFERALKATIGIDEEELSKRWRRFLKERYWPQVAELDPPAVHATQLTDHTKEFCYVNTGPSISPNGEYIAFLSDRSDYFDIYLMRTLDGKIERRLVHGQRTGEFEELKWLRPGISWSPDGKRIAVAAKAGSRDAIQIVDVSNGKVIQSLKYDSDGLFSPFWSPDGERIAFVYVSNGKSDLAVTDLKSGEMQLVTNDLYDDADPSWSPDGLKLLFTSNRNGVEIDTSLKTLDGLPISQFDVYEISLDGSGLARITDDHSIIRTPIWTPKENTILYVSNRSGVFNLYTRNLSTGVENPLSNVATGCFQPSLAGKSHSLTFASFYDSGYDIFLQNDVFGNESSIAARVMPVPDHVPPAAMLDSKIETGTADYSEYVFDRLFSGDLKEEHIEADTSNQLIRSRDSTGKYESHPYHASLAPDYVYLSASYSPYFRAQGSGMVLFSDVLGNHQLYLSLDLNRNAENSNFYTFYNFLPHRLGLGVGAFHYAYAFFTNGAWWRDRNYGLFAQSSYALNHYNRFEFGADYSVIDRSVLEGVPFFGPDRTTRSTVMPHIGYVHDTSIWRSATGPSNGARWRLDALWSPNFGASGERVPFTTLAGDWRRYFAYKKDYTLAFRLSGAASYGKNPQKFFMGGVSNWFNPRFDNNTGEVSVDRIEDIYYSSFIMPIRGVGYYNQVGQRYLLSNAEFRFPFIRHLMFGWPLPAYFRDIRGALFSDWGAAWNPGNTSGNGYLPEKGAFGFGLGIRIDLGIFPIEWDVAWSPDKRSNMVPQYYFSINAGF